MKRSLGEIEHTCRKAARGCGLPWGIADEVGKAIRWLHVYGFDGVSCLIPLLQQFDHQNYQQFSPTSLNETWESEHGVLSPIMAGICLCDCMEVMRGQAIHTGVIAYPLITAGFLGQTALSKDQTIEIEWPNVKMQFNRDVLAVSDKKADFHVERVEKLACKRIKKLDAPENIAMTIGDTDVDAVAWEELERYAYRTYVEATEASRLGGAGAGLTDND